MALSEERLGTTRALYTFRYLSSMVPRIASSFRYLSSMVPRIASSFRYLSSMVSSSACVVWSYLLLLE